MDRILLAEDDVEIGEMLTQYLASEDFAVDTAQDGETALAMAPCGNYDLVVLDVMMPRTNGLDVLRVLRTRSLVPVLMLSVRGADNDSVVGLELGADDYLAKPCNPRVLVARIRAVLRRAHALPHMTTEIVTLGDVEMHTGTRAVHCAGLPVVISMPLATPTDLPAILPGGS